MNTYYEKRPEFQAVQFNGPGSIEEIMKLCNPRRRNYTIEGENHRSKLTVVTEDLEQLFQKFVLNQGQWLVLRPDHTRVVMNDDEFRDQFETAKVTVPLIHKMIFPDGVRSPGVVPSPLKGAGIDTV